MICACFSLSTETYQPSGHLMMYAVPVMGDGDSLKSEQRFQFFTLG